MLTETSRLCDFKKGDEREVINDAIKNLQEAANKCQTHTGEALLMINKNYRYRWESIPWGRFAEMEQFIRSFSGDKKHIILDGQEYYNQMKAAQDRAYPEKTTNPLIPAFLSATKSQQMVLDAWQNKF
jgi:uncharacterized protein with HEPN domain